MSYSYTNTTAGDQKVLPIDLGLATNYSKQIDDPKMGRLRNATSSNEQPEVITYRSEPIDKISTSMTIRHPSPIRNGVQYVVKVETIDRTTDAAGNIVDEPIVAWLTIKHPQSDNWTNAKVLEVVTRLFGACLKGQTTTGTEAAITAGNCRFEDLMRGITLPATD